MDRYRELITVGRALWEEHLVTSHGGNLSLRLSPNKALITRTGAMLGFLKESDIIEVTIPSTREQFPKASSELVVHSRIYELTEAQAVVHAHPPITVFISLSSREIAPEDVEGKLTFSRCPIIEVEKPHASEEMAEAVAYHLKKNTIVCVRGHGTFARGKSPEEALFYTSSLEFSSRILLLKRLTSM